MPGEVIDRPNPQPLPSRLDDSVLSLAVKLENVRLDESDYNGLQSFRRAANYIAACECRHPSRGDILTDSQAMIFLQDNVLLERDLTFEDIKPRLLGLSLLR